MIANVTKAEEQARRFAEIARRRDGLEVEVEVEHREPSLEFLDGYTTARLTVREAAWYSRSAIYASWATGDGRGDHRRTTRFHARLYHGTPGGKRITARELVIWLGILGRERAA